MSKPSNGKKIGYIRVSSFDQNPDRQLEGIELDRTFTDKVSGKSMDRPQLDDLRKLVNDLTQKQVTVSFLKESLTFTGEDAPMSTLLLNIMGAFAEFERSLIKERQMEGIAQAKKRGVYKGRKPKLSFDEVAILKERVANGEPKAKIARDFSISRETLYQYLR